MNKNILITGINGFIGSNLANFLYSRGFNIYGYSKNNLREDIKKTTISFKRFSLENKNIEVFDNIDIIIHCAYDIRSKKLLKTNIEGTINLYKKYKEQNLKKFIFISSYSAKSNSKSNYALIKYKLEQYFIKQNEIIIRPGLVIGNGGIFMKIIDVVKKYPLIPLINGGKNKIPIISIDLLVKSILNLIYKDYDFNIFNIYQNELITYNELIKEMIKVLRIKKILINIPLTPLLLLFRILQFLKINLKIDYNNLIAFKENQLTVPSSHLNVLNLKDKSYKDLLSEYLISPHC